MFENCRDCKAAAIHEFDKKWKVISWYCLKFKEVVPEGIIIINCPGYEYYDTNLHDNNAARSNPQTRDNGIHQEE